jgi:hypothetical protein
MRRFAGDVALGARFHRWFDRHPSAGDRLVAAVTVLLVAGELTSGRTRVVVRVGGNPGPAP